MFADTENSNISSHCAFPNVITSDLYICQPFQVALRLFAWPSLTEGHERRPSKERTCNSINCLWKYYSAVRHTACICTVIKLGFAWLKATSMGHLVTTNFTQSDPRNKLSSTSLFNSAWTTIIDLIL